MMPESKTKALISILLIVISVAIIVFSMWKGLKIGNFEILSIEGILAKRDTVIAAEEKLNDANDEYEQSISRVNTAKNTFDKEKEKYEAISDETISIVKEATLEDDYDIEYIWVTLGNYAKANNLNIILYEPGSDDDRTQTQITDEEETTTNTTTNTNTTTTTTQNNVTTITEGTNEEGLTNNINEDITNNSSSSSDDSVLSIQVTGSYIDLCDFVFEIENDDSLRFKLDNISMSGSSQAVTATFDVKNTIVIK